MRWLLAAAILGWAGAASAQLFSDPEVRRRIDELRQEQQATQQRIDARLAAIESSAVERRAILDLAGQIEALRADFARSRGQIEVILNQLENAEKRQKDLYVDIDTRLRRLEQVREQAAAAPPEKPPADEVHAADRPRLHRLRRSGLADTTVFHRRRRLAIGALRARASRQQGSDQDCPENTHG